MESKQSIKLNLGCGKVHKQGYINADMVEPADIIFDVREGIPYKDNNFDRIEADNLLEHFSPEEFIFVMNEIHRVIKKGGVFWVRVPNALDWFDGAAGDFTHKKFFVPRSFNYFETGNQQYENYGKHYGIKGWRKLSLDNNGKFFIWQGTK